MMYSEIRDYTEMIYRIKSGIFGKKVQELPPILVNELIKQAVNDIQLELSLVRAKIQITVSGVEYTLPADFGGVHGIYSADVGRLKEKGMDWINAQITYEGTPQYYAYQRGGISYLYLYPSSTNATLTLIYYPVVESFEEDNNCILPDEFKHIIAIGAVRKLIIELESEYQMLLRNARSAKVHSISDDFEETLG